MTDTQGAPLALKIAEACTKARVGKTVLYQVIRSGELRAFKRGKSTLVLESDLRRWLESLPTIQTHS